MVPWFPRTWRSVNRTYLGKLKKAASYPGLEVIAKLATVLVVEPAICSQRGPSTTRRN
jgi:hypothetical protein